MLRSFNRESGLTIVIVTYDMDVSREVDRIISIRDGQVSSEFHRAKHYEDLKASGSGHLIAEIDGDAIRLSPARRQPGKDRG